MPVGSPLVISIVSNIVSLTAFKIFDVRKSCDLDLGWFKVIQGEQYIGYGSVSVKAKTFGCQKCVPLFSGHSRSSKENSILATDQLM